jgi:hypothetical protein
MKLEVIALATLCCALSIWMTGRWRFLRLTLPQIHAEAKKGNLGTSWAATVLGLLGIGLTVYATFWL